MVSMQDSFQEPLNMLEKYPDCRRAEEREGGRHSNEKHGQLHVELKAVNVSLHTEERQRANQGSLVY